jgi:hypothetical protein
LQIFVAFQDSGPPKKQKRDENSSRFASLFEPLSKRCSFVGQEDSAKKIQPRKIRQDKNDTFLRVEARECAVPDHRLLAATGRRHPTTIASSVPPDS